jgi:hypothetical protein
MEETLPEFCRQPLVHRGEDVAFAAVHQIGFNRVSVVVANEVKDTMGDEKLEFQSERDAETTRLAPGGVHRHHDLAYQSTRRLGDFQWKGEDVRPSSDSAVEMVEATDFHIVHERDLDTSSLTAQRPERTLGDPDQRPRRGGVASLAMLDGRAH